MYLTPSNEYNSDVEKIQGLLNEISEYPAYSGQWEHLKVDGYYGPLTEEAVKAFQRVSNIQQTGIVGDQTMAAMESVSPSISALPEKQLYISAAPEQQLYISAAPGQQMYISAAPPKYELEIPSISFSDIGNSISKAWNGVKEVVDKFMDLAKDIDKIVKDEVAYAVKLGKCSPGTQLEHFKWSVTRLDPKMKALKEAFVSNAESQAEVAKNTVKKQPYQAKTSMEATQISRANSARGKAQMRANISAAKARTASSQYIDCLKKYNIVPKVVNQLKKMGITGEFSIGKIKLPKVTAGGVFMAWSLKDIIWDLMQVQDWGKDEWKEDLTKDCYDFLDQMIVSLVSMVIAELIVGAVAAIVALAAGTVISGGALAVIVVIVALVIGLIIGWLISHFCGEDFSLSKFLFEGAATKVLEAVYQVKLD